MNIVSVAIPTPLYNTFDYFDVENTTIGVRVIVPFGTRDIVGIVTAKPTASKYLTKLKSIKKVLDKEPIVDKNMLNMLFWTAKYYHHPIGETIFSALPKNIKLGKELKIKHKLTVQKKLNSDIKPSNEQQKAIDEVLKSINNYQAFLLHGITGSGKTEVYLRISKKLISLGKQVLILVPEIGLTPQMIDRFSSRLDTTVSPVHSQLNATEKLDAYLLAKGNMSGIILGTRSAIFTPATNLGAIIIDEEHDSSFKQQSGLKYSARNLAFVRAKQCNIPLVLGSATPSLETLRNVADDKIKHLILKYRAGKSSLPKIITIDMKRETNSVLSDTLINKTKQCLSQKKQVMLFINRRGYAPIYHCKNCNWRANCKNCSTNMVLHNSINRLKCHHCGFDCMPMAECPDCSQDTLIASGYGTERLEEILHANFPEASIIRIDKDTTRRKKSMQLYLSKITDNKPCIIVGTQMLAKGHDFKNLAMVGVLDTDNSFFSIDFRATEYLAQLLMQVSGRAGRCEAKGEVYIQSRQVENRIFKFITEHNYLSFAKILLQDRKLNTMPPYAYHALICANSKDKHKHLQFLEKLKKSITKVNKNSVEILGPASAIIEKKANYYYANLYLSSVNRRYLHLLLNNLRDSINKITIPKGVRWFLDIDPI